MSKAFSATISSGLADNSVPVAEVETIEITRACTIASKTDDLQRASTAVVQATAVYTATSAELSAMVITVSQAQL